MAAQPQAIPDPGKAIAKDTQQPQAKKDWERFHRLWKYLFKGWVFWIILVLALLWTFGVPSPSSKELKEGSKSTESLSIRKRSPDITKLWEDLNYKKTLDLTFTDLKDMQLCGIKPGKRKYSFPREQLLNQEILNRRLAIKDHPNWHFIKNSVDGSVSQYNMADHVRINGAISGEAFEVAETGCVTVTHLHPKEFKEQAVVLGNTPNSPPHTVALLIQFE